MEQRSYDCKICGNVNAKFIKTIEGYKINSFFDVIYCKNCDTSFIDSNFSIDSELIYNSIYSNGKNVPGYVRYHEYSENVLKVKKPLEYLADVEDMYWAINDLVNKNTISTSMKIIEVGCGLGYLTYALSQAGFNITGVDISEKAISNAILKYGDLYRCLDIYEMAEKQEAQYDIIILTEVIEHVDNPKAFIKALSSLLTKDGKIILTTPNKSAYPKTFFWDTELPPVHLFWLSEDSIKNISRQINLAVNFTDFSIFNKHHIDQTKLFNYSETNRRPILDKDNSVIGKRPKWYKRKILNFFIDSGIKNFTSALYIKKYERRENWQRRHTMCAVISKLTLS